MEGLISLADAGVYLKPLLLAFALIVGTAALAMRVYCSRSNLQPSSKTDKGLDYAMGLSGLCLIGIPALDFLGGAPITIVPIALILVGIVLLAAAAREVFLEIVLSLIPGMY